MPNATRSTPRVVVVGAGIGGLVSALVLAHRGLDVTLLESAATPGGKIRQVQVDGVGVDSGAHCFHHALGLGPNVAGDGNLSVQHFETGRHWRAGPACVGWPFANT